MRALRRLLAAAMLAGALVPSGLAPRVGAGRGPEPAGAATGASTARSAHSTSPRPSVASRSIPRSAPPAIRCSICTTATSPGIGLTEEQIKAIAAAVTVPQGTDDQGDPVEGPATPANQFRSPFPNEKAARAANNGALPPDLSLIVNAREGHADYVYAILTGYGDPPPGMQMQDGMNYNKFFAGNQIAMPPPLSGRPGHLRRRHPGNRRADGRMTWSTFLTWAANPEMVQRKQIGWRVVLYLMLHDRPDLCGEAQGLGGCALE